ncbi:RICIN domain-containing protein [Streptomyces sp. NPDC020801]|uniref:RICIN domain-containing protein n=1 Tax=unclassified Streptomyces TaxID=2593676 RepID=UPI00379B03B9
MAALLTLALGTLGVAVSPLMAGIAHADSLSDIRGVDIRSFLTRDTAGWPALDLKSDFPNGRTETVLRIHPAEDSWTFVPNPNGSGSFQIRNDTTNNCLDYNTDDDNVGYGQSGYCDAKNPKQNWYVQPSDTKDNTYGYKTWILRNVNSNKCLDDYFGNTAESTSVGLHDCGTDHPNQTWSIRKTDPVDVNSDTQTHHNQDAVDGQLDDLAMQYALTQYDQGLGGIRSASYVVDQDHSDSAAPGTYTNVTPESGTVSNDTTLPADQSVSWSHTTGTTVTISNSVMVTLGVDLKVGGPVETTVRTSVAYTFTHSRADSVSDTQTGTATLHIKPGEHGWILRAQLSKRVTGTWTVVSDLGTSWTGPGSATTPVAEGTDNQHSNIVLCTSDSTAEICKDTDPLGA